MNMEQYQYPFDETSQRKPVGFLLNILSSIALIGLCYFIKEQLNKYENDK